MKEDIVWPKKTRDLHNHHMDSSIWDELDYRDDDIVIGTWAKSGTTWMQQIVGQLIFQGDPALQAQLVSPWLDLRVLNREEILAALEEQTHRRFIKTHLPLDALTFSAKVKYLYVGRDFPDVVWSLYNHLGNALDGFYEMFNEMPGRVGPPLLRPDKNVYKFWQDLLHNDNTQFWSFWENIRTWWKVRSLPNVMLLHFNDLKQDMPGEMRRIAKFLEIEIDESRWGDIVEYCSFDWMKANADIITPMAGDMWEGGAKTFINKGTNKRWKDVLNDDDINEYRTIAKQELGADCLNWLEQGGHV